MKNNMEHENPNGKNEQKSVPDNEQQQGIDKAPGEERGKVDQVSTKDLKGKKVDGDPSQEKDKPAS